MRTAEAQKTGALRLRCTPSDAEVTLDGVPQGRCDDFAGNRGLQVGEGLHRIELKKEGHWPYVTYYEASGATAVLEATLVPMSREGEAR